MRRCVGLSFRGVPLRGHVAGNVWAALPARGGSRRMFSTGAEPVPVEEVVQEGFFSRIPAFGADLLESFHVASGLPYWAVIVVSTVSFRLMLTPLMVASLKNAGVMARIKPEIEQLQARFRKAGGPTNQPAAKKFKEDYDALAKREGFSMSKSFVPVLGQMPGFIFFFTSIRRMLSENPDITSGGALWFTDLTSSDPYMRLNLMTSAVMFLSFKIGAESGGVPQNQQGIMKALAYVFPVLYLPLTMGFGQGLHLFWLTGATGAIAVNYALRHTPIGRAMGVPPPATARIPVETPNATFHSRRASKSAAQLKREHLKKHSQRKQ